MFDMAKMMAQAKKVQDRMTSIQDELAQLTLTGKSSDGLVTITCTGKFEFTGVSVDPAAMNGDASAMEARISEALQDVTNQIMSITEGKMKELTAGINIPGLKLPF